MVLMKPAADEHTPSRPRGEELVGSTARLALASGSAHLAVAVQIKGGSKPISSPFFLAQRGTSRQNVPLLLDEVGHRGHGSGIAGCFDELSHR